MTERDIIKAIDANTFEQVSFAPVTTWVDGTPMDDSKCDGVIYKKLMSGVFVKGNFDTVVNVRRFGARGMVSLTIQLLFKQLLIIVF